MSLSKEEIEKIYNIKEKLLITYKAANSEPQRRRISSYLTKIDKIIQDIEDDKWINPAELNIFSEELKKINNVKKGELKENTRISFIAKVENQLIFDKSKDSEMDQIYSFIMYFEKNFALPLGGSYLKLDYYLSKKRETFFAHYEGLKHLLKEYIEDLILLTELKSNDHIEKYKSRIDQQKKYFLVRLSELLHELKEFLNEILTDMEMGRLSIFNADEIYTNKFENNEKTDFEGVEMSDIIQEAYYFTEDFIEILRMPKFKKK